MKNIVYILSVILLASSCKSIEKMVEQGKYDEAIVFAAKKLHGEKNKKTKYVEALETAYHKVTDEDMNQIKFLSESGYANKYDRIYELFTKIEKRQSRIRPFLPLISEDGYAAHFKFVRTHDKLNEISLLAAESHYERATSLIAEYDRYEDKRNAREAYSALGRVEGYRSDYKDVNSLKREALDKGTTHVAVAVSTDHFAYAGHISSYVLKNFEVERLNSLWTKYTADTRTRDAADYLVVVRIDEVVLGVEREKVDRFHEKTLIEVGRKNLIEKGGGVVFDTLGNIITVPVHKEVFAVVTDVTREKSAKLFSEIIIKDQRKNRVRKSIPVTVDEVFTDYMCTFSGDKRALPEGSVKRLDNFISPFPHDLDMVENMSYQLRDAAYRKIEKEMRGIIARS